MDTVADTGLGCGLMLAAAAGPDVDMLDVARALAECRVVASRAADSQAAVTDLRVATADTGKLIDLCQLQV
jgi:hypothetical protein